MRKTIWPWVFGICNHCRVMTAWSCVFWKKRTSYGKILKILFRKFSPPHQSTLLCWNVVKCVRWEVDGIVRYLSHTHTKKTKFRLPLKLSLLRGWRPKSARASPNIWLTMFQISFKSVHFRRSYSLDILQLLLLGYIAVGFMEFMAQRYCGRTSVFGLRTFIVLRETCSWRVTTFLSFNA